MSVGGIPRRSILRKSMSETKKSIDKRSISFHENLKEVHEVENWKKYNIPKRSCWGACWDECTLI